VEFEVTVNPGATIFLNNWREWSDAPLNEFDKLNPNGLAIPAEAPKGWCVANCMFGHPRLTIVGTDEVESLSHSPGISGEYHLFVCMKEHVLECDLILPGQNYPERICVRSNVIPWNKWWKEIYIGKYQFEQTDEIQIAQAKPTISNPARTFGDLYYLKLVPSDQCVTAPKPKTIQIPPDREIVFYNEPHSLAYYHMLQNESMAANLVDEYKALGVTKIVSQMGRVGSYTLYRSEIAKRAILGEMVGDDHQSSNGVNEMLAAMDILEVFPRLCRKCGIKFIANMGVNMPYRGSTLETIFSAEHPEYMHPIHNHMLDFSIPEVLDYAAEHFAEIAAYDIDGISIDYMRYGYGQTTETIIALHRMIVEMIGDQRRKELEINIRVPCDDPDFHNALLILLKEDLVDSIIPSNLMSIHPKMNIVNHVELAKKYGKKIYACLDGWSFCHNMEINNIPRPEELEELAVDYFEQGADGLFFYQSEQILWNPFLRRFIKNTLTVQH
jgi:hypothetical protein